jgi:hypothetical protein
MRRAPYVAAVALAALAVGACGKSPEDKARDDGKQVGAAVRGLFDARSLDDAKTAAGEVRNAVGEVGKDARKVVESQVATQSATLSQGVEALTSGDLNNVKESAQQIRAQAESFRHSGNSVANEFWRGFEEGYDG